MVRRRAYVLTIRYGPRVAHERHAELGGALASLEGHLDEISGRAEARVIDLKVRRFEPIEQVVARLELKGPRRLRAGIDVRGDGSTEAYLGRLRRRLVEAADGETTAGALRRSLTER